METGNDRIGRDGPKAVLTLCHRIIPPEVHGNALSLRCIHSELDAQVGIDLGIFVAKDIGGSAHRLGDDSDLRVVRTVAGEQRSRCKYQYNRSFHMLLRII